MQKDIEEILRNHENRLSRLESLLQKKKSNLTTHSDRKNLTGHIIILRDNNFFSAPRTATEIHQKLKETYHCELKRVGVALLRLAKRRQLRKSKKVIDNKTYQAYVW